MGEEVYSEKYVGILSSINDYLEKIDPKEREKSLTLLSAYVDLSSQSDIIEYLKEADSDIKNIKVLTNPNVLNISITLIKFMDRDTSLAFLSAAKYLKINSEIDAMALIDNISMLKFSDNNIPRLFFKAVAKAQSEEIYKNKFIYLLSGIKKEIAEEILLDIISGTDYRIYTDDKFINNIVFINTVKGRSKNVKAKSIATALSLNLDDFINQIMNNGSKYYNTYIFNFTFEVIDTYLSSGRKLPAPTPQNIELYENIANDYVAKHYSNQYNGKLSLSKIRRIFQHEGNIQ
ncbi:MAG: hypothetical protein ACP5RP_04055 [Candidatus Micrarchaeia archaeon]